MGVLICSLGKSPAVVTETILELKKKKKKIERLILLTTQNTEKERKLLEIGLEKLESFKELNLKPEILSIDKNDIRNNEDVRSFRRIIGQALNKLNDEEKSKLIVCLAGGRKTMPIDLYIGISLAEGVKETYHVLVEAEEKAIEFQKEFMKKWGEKIDEFYEKAEYENEFLEDLEKLLDPTKIGAQVNLLSIPVPTLSLEERGRIKEMFFKA